MVERREIVEGQRVERLAGRDQRVVDSVGEAGTAPILGGIDQRAGLNRMSPYQACTVSPVLSVSVSTP